MTLVLSETSPPGGHMANQWGHVVLQCTEFNNAVVILEGNNSHIICTFVQ